MQHSGLHSLLHPEVRLDTARCDVDPYATTQVCINGNVTRPPHHHHHHHISLKTIPLHLFTVKADVKGITAGRPSRVRKRLETRKHSDLICGKDEPLFLF